MAIKVLECKGKNNNLIYVLLYCVGWSYIREICREKCSSD